MIKTIEEKFIAYVISEGVIKSIIGEIKNKQGIILCNKCNGEIRSHTDESGTNYQCLKCRELMYCYNYREKTHKPDLKRSDLKRIQEEVFYYATHEGHFDFLKDNDYPTLQFSYIKDLLDSKVKEIFLK